MKTLGGAEPAKKAEVKAAEVVEEVKVEEVIDFSKERSNRYLQMQWTLKPSANPTSVL